MGRQAVRAAITTFLQNAELPYVGTVYPARTYINEQDYEQNSFAQAISMTASGSSAVMVVHLVDDQRQREADTGRGAVNDRVTHNVALELFFACTAGDPIAGQGDYDVIVDETFTAIRSDATLGDPSVIWSAGEYGAIDHQQSEPFTDDDGMVLQIRGVIKFQAIEWVAGNV